MRKNYIYTYTHAHIQYRSKIWTHLYKTAIMAFLTNNLNNSSNLAIEVALLMQYDDLCSFFTTDLDLF